MTGCGWRIVASSELGSEIEVYRYGRDKSNQ